MIFGVGERTLLTTIWRIFPRRSLLASTATVVGALIEAASVAAPPLVLSMLNSDAIRKLEQSNATANKFVTGDQTLLILAALGFGVLFILKTILMSILVWIQSSYIYRVKQAVSQRIFNRYIHEEYEVFGSVESGKKINNLTIEMHGFVINFLFPAVSMVTELLVAGAMLLVAVTLQPLAALGAALVIGFSVLTIVALTRNRLAGWGLQRQSNETEKIQVTQQAMDSFKQIRVSRSEDYFSDIFNSKLQKTMEVETKELALQQLPRLWLEAVAVLSLVIVVVIEVLKGASITETAATAGLFALMAFRLMPSANRIIVALQKIRFAKATTELLNGLLSDTGNCIVEGDTKTLNKRWNSLRFEDVSFRYAVGDSDVLKNISFSVKRGECIGIVGPSGVGKSTLVDLFLSLLNASSGKVSLDGIALSEQRQQWWRSVGYVQQNTVLVNDTVAKNVAFGLNDRNINYPLIEKSLREAGLPEFATGESATRLLGERGAAISGGQKQRIAIARALYAQPDILVFDEATSSLDGETGVEIMRTIGRLKGKKTILIVSHQDYPLQSCDRVFKLDHEGLDELQAGEWKKT